MDKQFTIETGDTTTNVLAPYLDNEKALADIHVLGGRWFGDDTWLFPRANIQTHLAIRELFCKYMRIYAVHARKDRFTVKLSARETIYTSDFCLNRRELIEVRPLPYRFFEATDVTILHGKEHFRADCNGLHMPMGAIIEVRYVPYLELLTLLEDDEFLDKWGIWYSVTVRSSSEVAKELDKLSVLARDRKNTINAIIQLTGMTQEEIEAGL